MTPLLLVLLTVLVLAIIAWDQYRLIHLDRKEKKKLIRRIRRYSK